MEDGMQEAFLGRHDILKQDGLDARKAPDCPPTRKQQIANPFNAHLTFEAVTEVFPKLHSDFAEEISINRSD
jgi:hypothetical protein